MIGFDYWKIGISYPSSWAIKAMDWNVKGKNIYGGLTEEFRCSGVGFLNWTEFDSYNVVLIMLSNDTFVSLHYNLICFLLLMFFSF